MVSIPGILFQTDIKKTNVAKLGNELISSLWVGGEGGEPASSPALGTKGKLSTYTVLAKKNRVSRDKGRQKTIGHVCGVWCHLGLS